MALLFQARLINILFTLLGAAIVSCGVVHFNMQNNVSEGGVTGITLLFYFLWGWDPAISYFVLNVPVFFIGWKFLGRTTFLYTIIGTVAVSLFLFLFQINAFKLHLQSNMTVVSLFAAVLIGFSIGLFFCLGAATVVVDMMSSI